MVIHKQENLWRAVTDYILKERNLQNIIKLFLTQHNLKIKKSVITKKNLKVTTKIVESFLEFFFCFSEFKRTRIYFFLNRILFFYIVSTSSTHKTFLCVYLLTRIFTYIFAFFMHS